MSEPEKKTPILAYIFGISYSDTISKIEFRTIAKTSDSRMINLIKSGQRSLLTNFKIRKFSCSICNSDYEECSHDENENYEGKVCAPLMTDWEVQRVLVLPRGTKPEIITDMLVETRNGEEKEYVWYSYPERDNKKIFENLTKAMSKGWLDSNASSHFRNLFNISTVGIFSYPPNPKYILQADYRFDLKAIPRVMEKKELERYYDKTKDESMYIECEFRYEPERYEKLTVDNIEYLLDRFDKILIPYRETMNYLSSHIKGGNIYSIRPKTEDIDKYIATRMESIRKFMKSEDRKYVSVDNSEEFLGSLGEHYTRKYVILNIDLVGSTKMNQLISQLEKAKIIELFVREMSVIVDNYHGFVLKTVGDGLIIYFPVPTFWGMDDNALDCAVAMKLMIETGINKVLRSNKIQLQFRIGLETGDILTTVMGYEKTKQHWDMIGETIDLSAKIQSIAGVNQIVVGYQFWKNLGIARRKYFIELNPPNWEYLDKSGNPYKVYSLQSIIKT